MLTLYRFTLPHHTYTHTHTALHRVLIRCNSDINAAARRFLQMNHSHPVQRLGIDRRWNTYQLRIILTTTLFFLAAHILGPKQISLRKIQWPLWRRPGGTNCVPLVNNCRSVCLCREACLYVAGFPCTPFSVLHGGSKLLGDKNAGQLYEVIRRLKRLCPAASCHSLSRFEYISSGTFWKKHWKCPKPVWNLGWHTGKRGWLCAGHYYDLGGLAT